MKTTTLMMIAVPAALALAAGAYWLGRTQATGHAESAALPVTATTGGAPQKPGDVDPGTGRKVLYWHDPMVPGQRFDKPGKSPFMNMMLEPVYADSGGDASSVTIDPRMRQNIGVRTAEVTRARLTAPLTAVGSVAFNERDQAIVQARANGFVEKLHVRAPLDAVRAGQPLVELYVPDWVAAQEEYLAVRRMRGAGMDSLADAARQRMRLAGMSDAQIERIEAGGAVQPRMTIPAPIGGVVTELAVREGMTVAMGTLLYRINGLGSVWINAELPEAAAARVRAGHARRGAHAGAAGHGVSGPRQRAAAGSQCADAHDQGAHRSRQSRRASSCPACSRRSTSRPRPRPRSPSSRRRPSSPPASAPWSSSRRAMAGSGRSTSRRVRKATA